MTRLSRRGRLFAAILSLWALLFAQAVLAGYSCPGAGKAVEVSRMAEAAMPCAQDMADGGMDAAQPQLCHAHCQSAPSKADTYQPPAFGLVADLGAVLTAEPVPRTAAQAPPRPAPQRDGGPPIAIRHCCFRI